MTDEDRTRLQTLVDECDEFCLDLAGSRRLSREDHVEMALMFLHLADWILNEMIDKPEEVENDAS